MTQRGRMSLRLVELGFVALMGVAGATGVASAAPADDPQLEYILLEDGNTSVAGTARQLDYVRGLRSGNEPILWFRDGGQDYVSRDRALIALIDQAWKPVKDIGDQQSRLGDQQSKLGDQMSRLGDQVSSLAAQEAELAGQEADQGGARDQLRDRQRELRRQMKDVERQMRELSGKMNALGRDMSALGQKMQGANARAKLEVRGLLRRAIDSGAAKRV